MGETDSVKKARKFLDGENLPFDELKGLWTPLKTEDQLALLRRVIRRMRTKPERVIGGVPNDQNDTLWQQEALLTSKDPELPAVTRHDEAFKLLAQRDRKSV